MAARTFLTTAERAERVVLVAAARTGGIKATILGEIESLIGEKAYVGVAPVIASASTITHGAAGATVVVTLTGCTFKSAIAAGDLTIGLSTTALTLSTITRDTVRQVTLVFTGTADGGDLTILVKASGLAGTDLPSNTKTITVPAV